MQEKIIQGVVEFYKQFINPYATAYFSWFTKKLSGVEPFFVLFVSIFLIFALAIYIWFRNRDA
ncbi:MAG: hypothetical protein COX29_01570 [Candidatus Moranbacteria bacterium CG23_combo_of_CG06-09_8_20_14_all_35_22]|nr:MAG: hypothetical protein COX29_01570 [Candidatus Moranbacteria bacterium CG23_combo_of_CG06-09_8_20_14_all_35_22]